MIEAKCNAPLALLAASVLFLCAAWTGAPTCAVQPCIPEDEVLVPAADCFWNLIGDCTNPNQTCIRSGGTCGVFGSGSAWHDPDGNGCGCVI